MNIRNEPETCSSSQEQTYRKVGTQSHGALVQTLGEPGYLHEGRSKANFFVRQQAASIVETSPGRLAEATRKEGGLMFVRFHERIKDREEGFTLIELLVVILIIAILAAIAVPVFLSQRKKGWIAQSQSSLKNAATAQESFATANEGAYATTLAELQTEGFKTSANVTVTPGGAAGSYCIVAVHSKLGTDPWATASYDSGDGAPTADDAC